MWCQRVREVCHESMRWVTVHVLSVEVRCRCRGPNGSLSSAIWFLAADRVHCLTKRLRTHNKHGTRQTKNRRVGRR